MCVSVCVLFFLFFSFLFFFASSHETSNQRQATASWHTSLSLANEILVKGEGICLEAPTDVRSDLYRTKELGPLFGKSEQRVSLIVISFRPLAEPSRASAALLHV